MTDKQNYIELGGLDGSNPLAFLATLGALRCLDLDAGNHQKPRLAWSKQFRPTLYLAERLSADALLEVLDRAVKRLANEGAAALGDVIGVAREQFRQFAQSALNDASLAKLQFAAAYASDAAVDPKKNTVIPTAISFSNGQGGRRLLKDFRTLAARLNPERLRSAIFDQWSYLDLNEPTFRWDPLDLRTGAHMATDPGSTDTRSVMAGNALAFVGLSFLTSAPTSGGLGTTCFRRLDGEQHFAWPLWNTPITPDVLASLLQQDALPESIGVIARFASLRISLNKNLYLGGSSAI